MTLIYTPIPLPNESAASLLLRASYNNGYPSLSSFLNAYGFPVHTKSLNSMLSDQEKFKKIIDKLSICQSSVDIIPCIYGPTKRSQRIWNNNPISYHFFNSDGSKLCSECVKESGILKKEWLLKHLTCCTKHKLKLLTECTFCNHPISSNRKTINECYKCQKIFNHDSSTKLLQDEVKANKWFLDQLSSDDLDLIKSIKIFLSAIQATYITFKNFIIEEPPILLTYLFFSNQAKAEEVFLRIINNNQSNGHPKLLLVHFLTSMHPEIHAFSNKIFKKYSFNNADFTSLKNDFVLTKRTTAILIGANRAKLDENYFSFLKDENYFSAKRVNDYLLGVLPHPSVKEGQHNDYLTLMEASNVLGIYYELTCKLLLSNRFLEKVTVYKNNRPVTVISRKDLLKFNQQYITVNRLAKDLNVLTQYLTAKLSSIGIEAIHGPLIDDGKIDVFKRVDTQDLTRESIVAIKNYDRGFGHKTYMYGRDNNEINKVASFLNISIKDVKKLIKNRILKSYKRTLLQSFYISQESINEVNEIINSGKFISLKNVPSIIACPPNWLTSYWIDTKFLQIIDLKIDKYVSHSDLNNINNLRTDYFTGVEASRYLNMPHQHITNLHTQGLVKAYYFGQEKKIRLFLKSDIYALKEKYGL